MKKTELMHPAVLSDASTFKLGSMVATDYAKKKVEAFWHRCSFSVPKISCIVRDTLDLTAYDLYTS